VKFYVFALIPTNDSVYSIANLNPIFGHLGFIMECREGLTDLLGELYSNIDMLQKAITDVSQIKVSLKTTASDLKSQIRDSVSRHLEALRNRETWLLGQVEVVQHVKEDALHQQQSEFNKALGRLQSLCALLEQTGKVLDTESLECHARESIAALGDLNFSPEETKVINFVAQNFELHELIQKFGAVVVSDNPDADKQIVPYFQMLGLGKKSSFFTPSGPSEKWLMKTSGASTSQGTLKIHSLELNIQDWLQQKRVPGTSSTESLVAFPKPHPIEHWLSKGQSETCTAEKEISLETPESKRKGNDNAATIVMNKTSEIQGWLLDSSTTRESTILPSNQFSYYKVVKMSESSQWLNRSGIPEDALPTNGIGKTYNYSATSGADEWLKKKVESTGSAEFSRSISTQSSCSDCAGGLSSECSDLELDDTLSEMSDQLAVQNEDGESSSGIGAPSSYLASEVPDNDRWLLKQSCKTNVLAQNHTGIKKYKDNLAAQSTQDWLHPRSEQASENRDAENLVASGMKSYIDSLPVGKNHWVLNPSKDTDICKWLAGSSFERCKNCPTMCSKGVFEVFDQIASSRDGWLLSQELHTESL